MSDGAIERRGVVSAACDGTIAAIVASVTARRSIIVSSS